MAVLLEIDHWVNLGPIHLFKIEKPIDISLGEWEKKIGKRAGDPLNRSDIIESRLAVVDASSPSVELREYDGGVYSVIKTIKGSKINDDPVTRDRLRLK